MRREENGLTVWFQGQNREGNQGRAREVGLWTRGGDPEGRTDLLVAVSLQPQKTALEGQGNRLRAIRGLQFLQEGANVGLHGTLDDG